MLPAALRQMIMHRDFPCLGARSAVRRDRVTAHVYETLGDPAATDRLLNDLEAFVAGTRPDDGFATFMATYRCPVTTDEKTFERLL